MTCDLELFVGYVGFLAPTWSITFNEEEPSGIPVSLQLNILQGLLKISLSLGVFSRTSKYHHPHYMVVLIPYTLVPLLAFWYEDIQRVHKKFMTSFSSAVKYGSQPGFAPYCTFQDI